MNLQTPLRKLLQLAAAACLLTAVANGSAPQPESRTPRLLLADGDSRRLVLSTLHRSEETAPPEENTAHAILVSPAGDRVLCLEAGTLVLRRENGGLVRRITTGELTSPMFSADSSILAWVVASPSQAVEIAKAPFWKRRGLRMPAGTKAVVGLATPEDGMVVAALETQGGPVIAKLPLDGDAPELIALSQPAADVAVFAGAIYFTRRDEPGLWSIKAGARNDAEALAVSKLWIRSGSLRAGGQSLLFLGAETPAAATTDASTLHALAKDGSTRSVLPAPGRQWVAAPDGTIALLGATTVRLLRPVDCEPEAAPSYKLPEGAWRLVGFLR